MAGADLYRRSRSLVSFLDMRMPLLITVWIIAVATIGIAKVALSPMQPHHGVQFLAMMLPYLLVAAAPICGFHIASASFPRALVLAQPAVRLSRYGTWRQIDPIAARTNAAFGPAGLMASLVVGILLNVPLRTAEFMMAMPALGRDAPDWAQGLLVMMTLDLVVMNFFYLVCFVMALRSVPLFPRMLLFVWCIDILLQLTIAEQASQAGLPAPVAFALHALLDGNIHKVLISAALWLPYLILSDRVNITFRQRLRSPGGRATADLRATA